ncbi:ABC transporter substrate-binding protein [Hypericibacter terrae]|jgi:multiple sugar transport system substrate-binding protein|uniref:ABC transporter substrate-binding protein n=1 Tax=Hypericibacter terrae TaxID=2602015 RepID=A0A5J6MWU4_9PROT|nr:sugar ABC transporter substrate-binding protein [Hypericibacter terrae]QEX19236.1 ABC transporter substrate-binding protein [Hypericibacter terrae]
MSLLKKLAWAGAFAGLALGAWSSGAAAQSADEIAAEAAKKYAGTEITVVWEAGLQSLDPLNFSGPMWEKLTGMKVKVIEVPTEEMFTKIMQEYRAGTGAYDALNVIPSWMPDLAKAGALEPLDAYVDKYKYRDELQKIAPTFRDNQMTVDGKIYGFPDDGDVFIMYYRKDVFADPQNQADFKAKFGYDLAPPTTWKQFDEIGQFLTDKFQPKMYGAAFFRQAPYAQLMFQERFRNEGGKFFDANTMKATVNSDIGVKVLTDMRNENKFMPPGVETWGFVENLAAFMSGQTAMTISWPPYGRWAAGYGQDEKALNWVPKTQIAGKVGYALPPGGHPQLALGFALSVASTSKHKDAAYLFIQWLNSEKISTERVQLPYTLRDPFRVSHYTDPTYLSRWPDAKDYLATLKQASETGLLDLSILQTDKYEEALRQGISALWSGEDPKAILDKIASQWDAITEKIGVDKQKAAYQGWAAKSGAYPQM